MRQLMAITPTDIVSIVIVVIVVVLFWFQGFPLNSQEVKTWKVVEVGNIYEERDKYEDGNSSNLLELLNYENNLSTIDKEYDYLLTLDYKSKGAFCIGDPIELGIELLITANGDSRGVFKHYREVYLKIPGAYEVGDGSRTSAIIHLPMRSKEGTCTYEVGHIDNSPSNQTGVQSRSGYIGSCTVNTTIAYTGTEKGYELLIAEGKSVIAQKEKNSRRSEELHIESSQVRRQIDTNRALLTIGTLGLLLPIRGIILSKRKSAKNRRR